MLRLPVYERPEDPPWAERRREILHPGRQTSNTYMLKPGNGGKPPAQPPGSGPPPARSDGSDPPGTKENNDSVWFRGPPELEDAPFAPLELEHLPSSTPRNSAAFTRVQSSALEQPEGDHSPVEGVPPPVAGTSTAVRRHREGGILTSVTIPDDGWPEEPPEAEEAEVAGRLGPVRLVVPERDQLDHDPTAAEVLATITGAFGEVEAVEVRPHPTYPVARRGKVNLETCWTTDLHRALEGIDRDTCVNSGCRPGGPCPRHTRRKRGG